MDFTKLFLDLLISNLHTPDRLIKPEFKVDVLIDTVLIPEKFFYNKVTSLENNNIMGEFAVLIDSVDLFLKKKRVFYSLSMELEVL